MKEIIKNKKEAEELILRTNRNICLYGSEELLEELLKERKRHEQTIVCAGTERLAVIKDCIWLEELINGDKDIAERAMKCSGLTVIYGVDLISAKDIESFIALREKYNPDMQVIVVGDLKTQVVCRRNDYTTAAMAEGWKSLDFIEVDQRIEREDREFLEMVDLIRNGDTKGFEFFNGRVVDEEKALDEVMSLLFSREYKAREVNERIMRQQRPEFTYTYEAVTEGEMPETAYPMPVKVSGFYGMPVVITKTAKEKKGDKVHHFGEMKRLDYLRDDFVITEDEYVLSRSKWYKRKLKIETDEYGDDYLVYEKVGSFEQMPFIPGFALSLEGTYGMVIQSVLIDPTTKMPGELAAMLSRCADAKGLFLERPIEAQDFKFSKETLEALRS